MARVDLFVTDIDGCLATPFRPFRLDKLTSLRSSIQDVQAGGAQRFPPFTICSGRAYSYVECVVQVLAIASPTLFEAGGGMIDPATMQRTWNPAFTADVEREIEDVRSFLDREIATRDVWVDHDKRTQAGLIGDASTIARAIPLVSAWVGDNHPDMLFAFTPVSIDVVPRVLTKEYGIAWLCDVLDVPLERTAFIGDANGDIGGLRSVGYSFAPANAAPDVKEAVSVVTGGAEVDGVAEAYEWCARLNRNSA